VIIRPARLDDIGWLIEAGFLAQQEAPHYAQLPTDPALQYKRLVSILHCPDHVCVRVVDDRTGFICGALEPAVWFETTYAVQGLLWVVPGLRGSGRAWRLVAAWAREHGASRLYNGVSTEISPEHTERVARFYTKMGYREQGPSFYKELT
jgi:GNAT superfamily N-acetyltransferase